MKTAVLELINGYEAYLGSSKIIPLFFVALAAVYLMNTYEKDTKRRRINPAVFLLSIWSGIAYAMTCCIKKPARKAIPIVLFSLAMVMISGKFIFSKDAYPLSIYYYTPVKITVISIISIIAFFVIYYLISIQLFEIRKERMIFMGFILLLHLFSFYSEKSVTASLFLYPLSITSIVLHDILPFSLWAYLIYEKNKVKEPIEEDYTFDDDYEEEWDMKKHKILNMRNMAIAFGILIAGILVIAYMLNSKINNLYNATVALEEAAKGKVSMYEFIPEGKDHAEATLIISGDGNATVSGGGGIENGQALYEFISAHTTNVDRWYLYGDGDDNRGAFEHCLNSGITVDQCYYLSITETN